MSKTFHKGITTLAKCFNIDITPLSRVWSRIYLQRLQSRGKKDAVEFMKQLNTVAEQYALHQAIEPIPWTKSDNDNFPLIIRRFKPYLRSEDSLTVMFTLSVFRTVESLRLPISKDISSIIDPCQADDNTLKDIINFIPSWLDRLPPIKLPKMKYHFTLKNGPNGPALMESDSDIASLINSPKLLEAIRVAEEKQADDDPMELDDLYVNKEHPIHSKLTQFPEKAGKTRTIAIIDYYSQRCLHPLHKGLMTMLANLVSDGTYSHTNVGKYAQKLTNEKSFIACADLTAATDRYPAIIQRELLFGLLKDNDLANSLWTILADRTFTVAWSGELVTYKCGQPMGAHASWPLFALAHHLTVEYAGFKAKVSNVKLKYKLIGDDVIISDEKLWLSYKQIMVDLGLTINAGKTIVTPRLATKSSAEVAKQLYLNGNCLTPLTPGFVANLKKPHMFNTCMWILKDRYGQVVNSVPSPMLISSLFHKEKTRKLVWMLASNPINGYLEPSNEGYKEYSPWISVNTENFVNEHKTMLANLVIESASQQLGRTMSCLMFGQGCPWEDMTHPQPKSVRISYKAIATDLRDAVTAIKISFFNNDIAQALDAVPYIPNPDMPYMARTELRCKRTSSLLVKLYDMTEKVR